MASSKLFYGINQEQARMLAYEFAKSKNKDMPQSWRENKSAGVDWMKGFRRRVKDLTLRKAESTSLARAMSFNRENVGQFFDKLKMLYDRLNLTPERVWNLDETGVNTVINSGRILTEKGLRQVGQIKAGERGVNVTLCCCINALGHAIPPTFIFPRVNFKNHMLNGAAAGSLGLATKSGYMSGDLFIPVLKHFISYMKVSQENPAVLIFDNHSSHIAIESITIAKENGLTLLTLPPHCSHRMQPLDVSVFAPFKRFYAHGADVWQRSNPGRAITIYEVASLASAAIMKAFTPENITSGFRSTEIFPLNSEIFSEDSFLPSSVTDRPIAVEATAQQDESIDENPETQTSHQDAVILHTISPMPKQQNRPTTSRNKMRSAVITDTPEKQRLVEKNPSRPKRRRLAVAERRRTGSTSSDSAPDVKQSLSSSDEDVSITESETSSDGENTDEVLSLNSIYLNCYVVAKVNTDRNSFKKFVGQVVAGPDEDEDYAISFLVRSRRFKNGFFFPESEDVASVAKQEILKILPTPYPVSTTQRLSKLVRFPVDLSYVE